MFTRFISYSIAISSLFFAAASGWSQTKPSAPISNPKPPKSTDVEWRDQETGALVHRVTPPTISAAGLYHHLRAFTSDNRWMVFSGRGNAYAYDLKEKDIRQLTQTGHIKLVGAVPQESSALVVMDTAYYLVSIPDGALRRVADIPPDQTFAGGCDVTADGRFIVGVYIEMTDEARQISRQNRLWVSKIAQLHLKNTLYTVDLKTGVRKDFASVNNWVDHLQCSPTDPTLFTYVDQGGIPRPGDGIHVMRTDGTGSDLVTEGGGHHIWSSDGKYIYFNGEFGHGTPWDYWRWDQPTRQRERVLPAEEWNYHFVSYKEPRALVGDGTQANPYINLYRFDDKGQFHKQRLCHRITANLRSENMARFAPDGKSVFFNGDVEGVPAIFQVEIK